MSRDWAGAPLDAARLPIPRRRDGSSVGRRKRVSLAVPGQLLALAVLLAVGLHEVRLAEADLNADQGVTRQPVVTVSAPVRVVAPPVELQIPKLKLRTRLIGVRTQRNGTLGVPSDFDRAAWWSQGPAPGDTAAAVLVGHVDSKTGPAVFARVDELAKGDVIAVRRADGTTARFGVQRVVSTPKREFPTRAVYEGVIGEVGLRLITCGGSFDAARGHYRNNVIVFAALLPVTRKG